MTGMLLTRMSAYSSTCLFVCVSHSSSHPLSHPDLARWQFVEYKTWSHLICRQLREWKESDVNNWLTQVEKKNQTSREERKYRIGVLVLRSWNGWKRRAGWGEFFFFLKNCLFCSHICVSNCEKKAFRTFFVRLSSTWGIYSHLLAEFTPDAHISPENTDWLFSTWDTASVEHCTQLLFDSQPGILARRQKHTPVQQKPK